MGGMVQTVDILLATYNGEAFLVEQIESVLAQSFADWRLVIRDDGSTDGTLDIAGRYAAENPDRIVLVGEGESGLGASGNFARLMEHATAEYVMFCDQDDVWLPDKTERLLAAMRALEAEAGKELPLLVHSDLRVVGADLRELHPSFLTYQFLDPAFGRCLNRLLIQNVVTGCACLCNRRLIEISLPVADQSMMHDWWIALVAAAFGRIGFVAEPTVLYRQHGANTLGAKQSGWLMALRKAVASPLLVVSRTREILRMTQRQAAAFLASHGRNMDDATRRVVRDYAELSEQGFLARRASILRNGFLGAGRFHKLIILVFV